MKIFSNSTFKNLIEKRGETCVSIYMPTVKVGQETQQNPIRMKNLIAKAENLLNEQGLDREEVTAILQPARDLVEQRLFWQQQSHGLALFLSRQESSIQQLPLSFKEQVFIGQRFYLKPIMPLLSGDGRFYLLRLDLQEPVLYLGNRFTLERVEVDDLPQGIEDALRFDDPEKQLQHQTTSRTQGGHDAIHHGHGDEYDKKENILRYFHQIDDAVSKELAQETAPLVLVGVNYLLPIYRETNEYPHVFEKGIGRGVDAVSDEELLRLAWEVVEPHFQESQEEDRERYFAGLNEGLASNDNDLEEIVAAAYYGRVDTLFVSLNQQRYGTFNPQTGRVILTEEAEKGQDLLDYAAVHTLNNSGKVYAVNADYIPNGGLAAAVFRYPLDQEQTGKS